MPLYLSLNQVDISNRPEDNYFHPILAFSLNEKGGLGGGRIVLRVSEFSRFSNIYFEHSKYFFKSILGFKFVFINTIECKFRQSNSLFQFKKLIAAIWIKNQVDILNQSGNSLCPTFLAPRRGTRRVGSVGSVDLLIYE